MTRKSSIVAATTLALAALVYALVGPSAEDAWTPWRASALEPPAEVADRSSVGPADEVAPLPAAPATPSSPDQASRVAATAAPRIDRDESARAPDPWSADQAILLVAASDPRARSRGIEFLPRRCEPRIIETLERLLDEETDPDVLERAVFALAETLRRDAIPHLRRLALDERALPRTREAALAAIDLVDTLEPRAPRGSVRLDVPGPVHGTAPFEVRVRLTSRVDAPRASLRLVLGRALAADGLPARWEGALASGQTVEVRFALRFEDASAAPQRIRARLKLDPEEALDVEVLEDSLAVVPGAVPTRIATRERTIALAPSSGR